MSNEIAMIEPEPQTKDQIDRFVAWSESFQIRHVSDRENAIRIIQGWKRLREKIVLFYSGTREEPGMKPLAYQTWKKICDSESFFLTRGDAAEKFAKNVITRFDSEEEEKRKAKEALLQAEKDEKDRKERERFLTRAEKAEAKGHVEKAEALREEATMLDYSSPVQIASSVPKMKGVSTVSRYKAVLVSMMDLIKAAADGNTTAFSFLEFRQGVADRFGNDNKGQIPVPGVKFNPIDDLRIGVKS